MLLVANIIIYKILNICMEIFMRTKKNLLAFALTIALSAGVSLSASAKTTLKLSHNNDKTHPVHISMQYMADEVKN